MEHCLTFAADQAADATESEHAQIPQEKGISKAELCKKLENFLSPP